MSTSPPPYLHSQLCVCPKDWLHHIHSLFSPMSNNDKPGRQSVDNNHRDASCFSRPSAGFFKCVSCVSLRVAVQRSCLLYWQVDLGYLLNLHSLLTHSQTVSIKVSTVPSVAFCAKSRLKVDKSRLSSHNAGWYVRLRRAGNIDLFVLDLAAAATVVTYLPVNLLCPRDSHSKQL